MRRILFLLPFIIFTGCIPSTAPKSNDQPVVTEEQSDSANTPTTTKPAEYVNFDVDGRPRSITSQLTFNEYPGSGAVISAFGDQADFFQISLPIGQTGEYHAGDPQTGLHYGINEEIDGQYINRSFETNVDGGDEMVIQVEQYGPDKVSGTFHGALTEITPDGFATEQKQITEGQFFLKIK